MIHATQPQSTAAVAAHYDALDPFYREIWGEHVHHGYWADGRETPAQATEALVALLAEKLYLTAGQRVCDIGCGYGAGARYLAAHHLVQVTGVTVSSVQARLAASAPAVRILEQDWLSNNLPSAWFDRAYAIESSEHMADKQQFFDQARRVLKPGGRFAVCAWLACNDPRRWEIRHLLEPICREGRLPNMGTEADYRTMAARAGFQQVETNDLSERVRRTWTICIRRTVAAVITRPRYLRFLLDRSAPDRVFALTLFRILIAYRTRSMRYCLMVFQV